MTLKHAAAPWIREQILEIFWQKKSEFNDEELAEVLPCEWEIRAVKVEIVLYVLNRIMIETKIADVIFVDCGIHNIQMIPFNWSIRELRDVVEQG